MNMMDINFFMHFLKKMNIDWEDEPFDSPKWDDYWNDIQVKSKQKDIIKVSLISVNF